MEEREAHLLAWYDDLAIQAAGRLYMTEEEVLTSDINFLRMGVLGHQEFMHSIFGGDNPSSPSPTRPQTKLTPKLFDAVFGRKTKKRK